MAEFGKFCELCEKCKNPDFKCGRDSGAATTKMQIMYESKEYAVQVCTACEDEATPKVIREKISLKVEKFKKLIEDAKSLGLDLTLETLLNKNDGLIVVTPVQANAPAAPIVPVQPAQTQIQPKVEPERLLDEKGNRIRPQQIKLKEMQVYAGNLHGSGRPIALPKKEVGNTGTTYYNITKTTDKDLQERFRRQAQKSNSENLHDRMEPSRYKMCSNCAGEGHMTKVVGGKKAVELCKVCDGAGMLK